MSSIASPPPPASPYTASPLTTSSTPSAVDHYRLSPNASPIPSPSTLGSVSRWRSVFKIGKNGSMSKPSSSSSSSRPTFLAADGKGNAFSPPFLDEFAQTHPTLPKRVTSTRAHTDPVPLSPNYLPNAVGELDLGKPLSALFANMSKGVDGGEIRDGGERPDSSGSSYHVHLGPTPITPSLQPAPPSTSGEGTRPFSTLTTDTSRSSRSSGSRVGTSSNQSPAAARQTSSVSLYTNSSTATPHRPQGLGLGFKSRIFSSPAPITDGPSNILTMGSPRVGKKDKSRGLGKHDSSSRPGSSRKKSVGSSSISSPQSPVATSPQTPQRRPDPSTSSSRHNTPPESSGTVTPGRSSSAAARFIRRVVSAPNTKALFGADTHPPPLPPKSARRHPNLASPVVVVNASATPSDVDLSSPPHTAATSISGLTLDSPMSYPAGSPGSTASLPYRNPTSPLNPNGLSATGTRAARSLTAGAAAKKDVHAALGIGLSDSRHKQVFRRTYSSNSIKLKSVEVSPSSFQKIKLLGKGDVGKVYLVREKKTDKLFAMKGGLLQRS